MRRWLAVVLAFSLAVLVGCGEDEVGVAGAGSEPSAPRAAPPSESGPITLWLSTPRVPVGGADLVAVIVNRSEGTAMFGVAADLDEPGSYRLVREAAGSDPLVGLFWWVDPEVFGETPTGPVPADCVLGGAAGGEPLAVENVGDPKALEGCTDGVGVVGWLLVEDGTTRLCEALGESLPPSCGGASLDVQGLDPTTAVGPDGVRASLRTEAGTTWSAAPVEVVGLVRDGVLVAHPR